MQAVTSTDMAIYALELAIVDMMRAKVTLQAGIGDNLPMLYGAEAVLNDTMQRAERLDGDLGPAWGEIQDRIAALGGVGVEDWAEG